MRWRRSGSLSRASSAAARRLASRGGTQPRRAFHHGVSYAAHRRRDHRFRRRHRFDHGVRKPLEVGAQHRQVQVPVRVRDLGAVAGEPYDGREAEGLCLTRQILALRTVADDDVPDVWPSSLQSGGGVEEHTMVLHGRHPRHDSHEYLVAAKPGTPRGTRRARSGAGERMRRRPRSSGSRRCGPPAHARWREASPRRRRCSRARASRTDRRRRWPYGTAAATTASACSR